MQVSEQIETCVTETEDSATEDSGTDGGTGGRGAASSCILPHMITFAETEERSALFVTGCIGLKRMSLSC